MTHSTGESRIMKVVADQTTTVGAKQDLDVGDELTTEVSGTRTIMVGGLELYDITGNRKLNTTPYGEVVGALYGLQCNQHNAEVLGASAQSIGGNATYTAGVGMGESVAGGRIHEIGGSFKIKCSDYGENVLGWKTLKTGSCTVISAAGINTEVSGSGTVKISGPLKVRAAM
jgi:type VI secretion system secreted protein VgrG